VRAYDSADLAELKEKFLALVKDVATKRRVKIELGPEASAGVAPADPLITSQLRACAKELGLRAPDLPSPASHDSAAFYAAGIPFGFLFIRNPNGSHHPDEEMSVDDFLMATSVLTQWLVTHCCKN
jgi:beta-ureidopropionase / N-carbamoyl-L-amino-acid hydrolase